MWNQLSIPCWPTLLILGPSGEALFLVIGEGQKEDVVMFVKCALRYYRNIDALQPHNLPLSPSQHVTSGPLLFPGKVACIGTPTDNEVISLNNNSSSNERLTERLAVSDTGHHRIIVFSTSGRVEINLKTLRVTTLFEQDGCSPWDLCLVSSSLLRGPQDMDRDVLLIVMAGVHQVWGLFLDTALWWKGKVSERVEVEQLDTKGSNKAFKVGLPYEHLETLNQPDFWPKVIVVRKYNFRGQRTNGIRLHRENPGENEHY
ncbi:hypothetical protein C0J52_04566 [Blattella germanica]|nr:hypothetical protein C0J52_04566 [Blattella germanica]